MNKRMIKALGIVLVIMTLVAISTSVFAEFTPGDVNTYVTKAENTNTSESVKDIGGQIISIISIIGMIAAVGVLMVLGVKYMLGSVEEKAQYKKTLMPYIIGAVLVFAASSIASIIYNLF